MNTNRILKIEKADELENSELRIQELHDDEFLEFFFYHINPRVKAEDSNPDMSTNKTKK